MALNQRLEEDKIATTSPGFGIAAAADGTRYPYLFPIAATYWSQGAAAVQFVKDKLGGSLKGKKIAYIFHDNPAGRNRCRSSKNCRREEGSSCGPSRCRRPGSRSERKYSTSHNVIGRISSSPTSSGDHPQPRSRRSKRTVIPCRRWSGSYGPPPKPTSTRLAALAVAEGYHAMQFAGAGDDYPVRKQIKAMYKKGRQGADELMDKNTVVLQPWSLQAAIHVEEIRNALKANGGKPPTGPISRTASNRFATSPSMA